MKISSAPVKCPLREWRATGDQEKKEESGDFGEMLVLRQLFALAVLRTLSA
jgi:hypothetical protein